MEEDKTRNYKLDALVAKIEGIKTEETGHGTVWKRDKFVSYNSPPPYSSQWSLAGPIIEREKIDVAYMPDEDIWGADIFRVKEGSNQYMHLAGATGKTPLEAAMSCYVILKIDKVEEDGNVSGD